MPALAGPIGTGARGHGRVTATAGKEEILTGREKGQCIINTVQKEPAGEETTVPLQRGHTGKTHLMQTEAGGARYVDACLSRATAVVITMITPVTVKTVITALGMCRRVKQDGGHLIDQMFV